MVQGVIYSNRLPRYQGTHLASSQKSEVVIESAIDGKICMRVGADVTLADHGGRIIRLFEHLRYKGHAKVDAAWV